MPSLSLIYWIILIVAALFGGYRNRDTFGAWAGDNLVYLVLFIIIGLTIFGK